ncbi:MAG: hypothetical protein ACRD1T_10860 [Acidimicrobiia bacterium]
MTASRGSFSQGLRILGLDACRELPRVLTSADYVRADVIGQLHRAGKHDHNLLILLEEKEWAWQAAIEQLCRPISGEDG